MLQQSEATLFSIAPRYQFRLDPKFLATYHDRPTDMTTIGLVTLLRTYAQRKSDGTLETWWEICQRCVEYMYGTLVQQVRTSGQWLDMERMQRDAQEAYELMFVRAWMPPGRGCQFMGTKALELKGSAVIQNCGFVSTKNVHVDFAEPFCTLMDLLMLGVGMGSNMAGAGKITIQAPVIDPHYDYVVEDSREGWVDALRHTLNAYIGKNKLASGYDFSRVRAEGARLETLGGTSSGHKPLMELLFKVREILDARVGLPLRSVDIADIHNNIGKCVVSGNIRRSAEIMIGDPTDAEFVNLKDPSRLIEIRGRQAQISQDIPKWREIQEEIDEVRTEQKKYSVLSEEYAVWQSVLDTHAQAQRDLLTADPAWSDLEAEYDMHPNNLYRWASNNTVSCPLGQAYDALADQTVRNGEPGYLWLDVARQYGRLADPPGDHDAEIEGVNPCVPAGTRILTRDGYRAIETLIEEPVDVWNGDEWSRVVPTITGHNQPLVRVTLSDGTSLVCTEYHQWILVEDRRRGSELRVKAVDLLHGDTLVKYAMPVIETGRAWDAAYTHGFFCGDGQEQPDSKGVLLYGVKKELVTHLQGRSTQVEDAYGRLYVGLDGTLPSKFVVPLDLDVPSRLAWMAGLLDADGCVLTNPNSVSLQISSVEPEFLHEIRLLLTTLGVQAKVTAERGAMTRRLPDGKGGHADYACRALYRLLINAADTHHLVSLGLRTHRLDLPKRAPQRDARRFVTVESVEKVGTADVVYCFNEPRAHRGTFEGIVTANCGEQGLEDFELCTLVETYPTRCRDLAQWQRALKFAFLYGKVVTLIPTHNPKINAVIARNRRIGTSMAGVFELYEKLGMREFKRWCDEGYAYVTKLDKSYSGWMGVGRSIKKTSVKPGGSVPLIADVEGGMKIPTARFYMRTMRIDYLSPLIASLKAAGYRVEPDRASARTMVVYFPCHNTRVQRVARDVTLWEQALLFTALQRHWSDNLVSATLTFQPHEAQDIARLLEAYEGQWKGVSFLPLFDHPFAQAPYIPCSEEEYHAALAKIRPLDLSVVDHGADEKYCSGDRCEAPPLAAAS